MAQEISLTHHLSAGARGVRVYFVLSRTSITSCEVQGLKPGVTSIAMEITDYGVDIQWAPEVPENTELVLSLGVEGEPIVFSHAVWRDAEGTLKLYPEGSSIHLRVLGGAEVLQDFKTYTRAIFLARCAIARTHANEQSRKYGQFFCELDLYTNRKLLHDSDLPEDEKTIRDAIIKTMEDLLGRRLLRRRRWAKKKPMEPAEDLPRSPRCHVEYISKVLLDIYRRHLAAMAGGDIDANETWTAFELFANGELRIPDVVDESWNGEPNGAHLFSFAEFVFMAIEWGVDLDCWFRILPGHVAVQQIYCVAYSPLPKKKLRFESYDTLNWSKEKMEAGDKLKEKLRIDFKDLPLRDLQIAAGLHLCAALKDQ